MKTLFVTVALLVTAGACSKSHYYNNSEATLMVNSSVKETCSCVFVLERDTASCEDYSRLIGPRQVVLFNYDHEEHTVEGRLLGYHAKARFVNAEMGCVLE